MAPENGWNEYQKLILYRLDEQGEKLDSIEARLQKVQIAVTVLKLKMAAIGTISGSIAGAIMVALLRHYWP